nr:MAG TPA: hypothetical protein [Caudoviricetes sp.]
MIAYCFLFYLYKICKYNKLVWFVRDCNCLVMFYYVFSCSLLHIMYV